VARHAAELLVANSLASFACSLASFVLQTVFSIVALNAEEWKYVVLISFPVLLIDEVLKWISRTYIKPRAMASEHKVYEKKKDE
jgi:Ca2+ transporting ATPase